MRLLPLVLTALLLCLPRLARGAAATGEAPPSQAGLEEHAGLLMWGTWGTKEAPEGLAKGEVSAGLWVAQVDLVAPAGAWSGNPEVRVAGATACAGFPTGADPPEKRSWSVSCARVGGEVAEGFPKTPYGELRAGPNDLDLGLHGLFREARGEADELGLLLTENRHASSASGWVRRDPGGFVDGPNRYLWVFNNPFRWSDRDGLAGEQFLQAAQQALPPAPVVAEALRNFGNGANQVADALPAAALHDAYTPDPGDVRPDIKALSYGGGYIGLKTAAVVSLAAAAALTQFCPSPFADSSPRGGPLPGLKRVEDPIDDLERSLADKGKSNQKDTGLSDRTDEQIQKEIDDLSKPKLDKKERALKRRLQREQNARKLRNVDKRKEK